jgi:DNA-directed RNA polymerase specialized sigma24 family protein
MSEDEPPDVIGNDDSSFEDFVAGSSARLFTMARLLTGGNRAEAEDLLEGAYERAYRRWGRITRRADPERYVRQILVNASVDRWRRIRRHPEIPLAVRGADPRTADTAATAGPAPAGLLDGIHRRHRRHNRRIAAACAAVVAFGVAGTLITRGVVAGPAGTRPPPAPPAATGPAVIPSATPSGTATGAPGTVLRDCESNNGGTLGSAWKAHSIHAGPVWFIYARPKDASLSHRMSTGKVAASAMVIAVENGRTAVVSAAPGLDGRFRFLASFHGGDQPYTLAEGAPGLTLAGCPAGPAGTKIPEIYAPGLTMFWQGYVTDLRGCIPLEVRTSPASQPVRVTVAPGNGSCGS